MIFSEQKVAQMAAYFLHKRGGRMSYLKLMKLLYLSDREAMNRFEEPISFDRMVSMPHGPVLSQTYDLITGQIESQDWLDWIAGEANYEVSLKKQIHDLDQLDELCRADIEIMDAVWNEFGGMTRFEIRDYTHAHCPEWEDPRGSSFPIDPRAVFQALGRTADQADDNATRIRERKQLGAALRSLQ